MTAKYWDSLEENTRYRALKAVLITFSESTLRSTAKEKAKEMDFIWEIVQKRVRMTNDDYYPVCVNGIYIP